MKKLIILFLILSILIIGCSNSKTYAQKPSQPPSPIVGSGCSASETDEEELAKIKYVKIQSGF